MTLHRDRDKPKRPPMSRRTQIILGAVIVAVFAFVIIVLAVSGQSFF
jgi:hypothetical protein